MHRSVVLAGVAVAAILTGCAAPGVVYEASGPEAAYDTPVPGRGFASAAPRFVPAPPGTGAAISAGPGAGPSGKPAAGGPLVSAPVASGPVTLRPRSSGTGFHVAPGRVVTNAHVVAGCAALQDDRGGALTVVAADPVRDLALLRAARPSSTTLPFNARGTTELGENVVVLGYPYGGSPLSTGLNLTAGIVSAQAGFGGSTSHFQITAPVQPGNSGGPVLDDSGGVIGVVQARVNDLAVLRATGTVPQNINFAIRGETVEGFLRENGVPAARVSGGRGLSASAISAGAQEAVVSVRCFG